MAADELLEAARLMRGRASAASKGVWVAGGIGDYGWSVRADLPFPAPTDALSIETYDSEQGRADAEHIASWNPAVALAVAEWLEMEANMIGVRELSDEGHSFHALKVARAYLAGEA